LNRRAAGRTRRQAVDCKDVDRGTRALLAEADALGATAACGRVARNLEVDRRVLSGGIVAGIDTNAWAHAAKRGDGVVVRDFRRERAVRIRCFGQDAVALGVLDRVAVDGDRQDWRVRDGKMLIDAEGDSGLAVDGAVRVNEVVRNAADGRDITKS